MSTDARDVMKRVACAECGECCEDYAPGISSVIVDGLPYHPLCAPVTATEASAAYAKEVYNHLTVGKDRTRSHSQFRESILDEEETEELLEAYLLGTPAIEFAKRLENRDIAEFERASDPCPDRAWPNAENE